MDLARFPFNLVARLLQEGKIIPFLGAGASIAGVNFGVRLPSGRELANKLRAQLEGAYPGAAEDDLAKTAQFYEYKVDRATLYDQLHEIFHTQQRGATLGRVPRFIASLPWEGLPPLYMVSTNFDTQIESAFQEVSRPLCVITQYVSDPQNGATHVLVKYPDEERIKILARDLETVGHSGPTGTAYLYKMHGSADHPPDGQRDSLVVTEDDYVNFLVSSGSGATIFVPPPVLTLAFRKRHFLFLGYSLEDWNFRVLLGLLAHRRTLGGEADLQHWAVQKDISSIEESLWGHRKVALFEGDLVDFVDSLDTRLLGGLG